VLLTFFPEYDRESIDAIATNYMLKNGHLVPIVTLDGSTLRYKQLAKNKFFIFIEIANVLCCLQRLREGTFLCVQLKPDVKVLSGCN